MTTAATQQTTSSPRSPERATQRPPTISPFVDVLENADELLLVADLPGASADSVDVHVDNGELTLSAGRASAEAGSSGSPSREYRRVFTLPRGIDGSKIDAELRLGVLRVHLPKSEARKPRRIDVKAS
jgi:HSP20 family protein